MYNQQYYPSDTYTYSQAPVRLLQSLNLLGLVGTLVVNVLANALPIHGKTTGQLSDQYPNLFTPAGLTFSIWGIIYLLLIAFGIYQAKGLFRKSETDEDFLLVSRIGFLFFISCLANIAWILAWHYEYVGLSVLIMGVLFYCLLSIYLRLETNRKYISWQEKYLVNIPFSVYFGWITVAAIANITAWLVDQGWGMGTLPEETWAIVMIGVATCIGLFILAKRRDAAYGLVIAWALLGIAIKRWTVSGGVLSNLILVTVICLLIISVGAALVAWLNREKKVPTTGTDNVLHAFSKDVISSLRSTQPKEFNAIKRDQSIRREMT
ncbi:MAG: hypothetical protein V4714_22310 [Bacteroidota bacterium]